MKQHFSIGFSLVVTVAGFLAIAFFVMPQGHALGLSQIATQSLAFILLGALITLCYWLRFGAQTRQQMACVRPKGDRRFYRQLFLLTLAFWLLKDLLLPFPESDFAWIRPWLKGNHLGLVVLYIVVVAPIIEELIFRQFLFQSLQRLWRSPWPTICLASLPWALLHSQYGALFLGLIFSFGLLLGWVRYRSQSLLLPILIHALLNLLACLMYALGWGVYQGIGGL
ncbi:type II CAAX endopeptidase family protein [Ferrimonas pelagia]